jgi:hypothetical protein
MNTTTDVLPKLHLEHGVHCGFVFVKVYRYIIMHQYDDWFLSLNLPYAILDTGNHVTEFKCEK